MNTAARWGASFAVLAMLAVPASAQTFRWTSQGDALTMDPHSQNEGPTIAMTGQIYESLVSRDPALNLVPELATEWKVVDGGWEFALRQGVKFHDGSDFTAEDVAFSFERAKAASSDWKEQVASITDVEIVDEHTVILRTDGPNPILPNQLTSVYVMDKTWSEANDVVEPQDFAGKEETYSVRNANGTGPYILEERAPDELTVLSRNADWWGWDSHPGNIERIEYRPISNAATRVAALLSGEVDLVLDPPLQDLKRIEAAEGLEVRTVAQIRSIFFGMDQGVDELRSSSV
ncbi:MAG TPA: ABC transporter substrate-binding protein, partial [Paracoccaceae bacterium]|nr:ABC transporter substrate-binding protein [Paracoccaceae bacterium]